MRHIRMLLTRLAAWSLGRYRALSPAIAPPARDRGWADAQGRFHQWGPTEVWPTGW